MRLCKRQQADGSKKAQERGNSHGGALAGGARSGALSLFSSVESQCRLGGMLKRAALFRPLGQNVCSKKPPPACARGGLMICRRQGPFTARGERRFAHADRHAWRPMVGAPSRSERHAHSPYRVPGDKALPSLWLARAERGQKTCSRARQSAARGSFLTGDRRRPHRLRRQLPRQRG